MDRFTAGLVTGIVVGTAFGFLAGAIGFARAHDAHDWMRQQTYRNPKTGEHCCSPNQDCKVLPPDQIKATHGGYRLWNGEVIPYAEALRSQDENIWRCETAAKVTRCLFIVPPGS